MYIPEPLLSISKLPNTYIPYLARNRATHMLFSTFTKPRLSSSLLLTRVTMTMVFSSPENQFKHVSKSKFSG